MALDLPFTLQVCPATFTIILDLLQRLLPAARSGDAHAVTVVRSVLRLLAANVRRLVVSGVRPRDAGLDLGTSPAGAGAGDDSKTADDGEGERESKDDGAGGSGSSSSSSSVLDPLKLVLDELLAQVGASCARARARGVVWCVV